MEGSSQWKKPAHPRLTLFSSFTTTSSGQDWFMREEGNLPVCHMSCQPLLLTANDERHFTCGFSRDILRRPCESSTRTGGGGTATAAAHDKNTTVSPKSCQIPLLWWVEPVHTTIYLAAILHFGQKWMNWQWKGRKAGFATPPAL